MTPAPNELLDFAHRLADVAGATTRPLFRTALEVTRKRLDVVDAIAIVTEADHAAEAAMRALIRARYPEHGILGEEQGHENPEAELTWVLDPIDGTKAFVTGFPTWGTLIALRDWHSPILGIMDQPFTGERFVGTGEAAFLGDRRLATRACERLGAAVLSTTALDMFGAGAARAAFDALWARCGLRRLGGDCYAYAMLAHGFIDLVVEADLAPWDIQALIPIIEGAGGVVTTWDGGPADAGGQVIAAGDARAHAAALKILASAAGQGETR
ncbi:MAG: histidinol-phosphatase [Alphaproteobacteria bacterium]